MRQEFGFFNSSRNSKTMLSTRFCLFKNAGVVLMTENSDNSAGREGEFAQNNGILCHRIFPTGTRHGHLI